MELKELIGKHIKHYGCENGYYACVCSEDSPNKPRSEDKCDCGRKEKIESIVNAITDAGYIHKDSISDLVKVCKSCYGTGRISGDSDAKDCEYCKGCGIILKGEG